MKGRRAAVTSDYGYMTGDSFIQEGIRQGEQDWSAMKTLKVWRVPYFSEKELLTIADPKHRTIFG